MGGASVADHLKAVDAKGRRKKRRAAEGPVLPRGAIGVWNAFAHLSAARPSGGFGPGAISFTEIEAYSRLTGHSLVPWEVEAIRALDGAYLAQRSKE